MERTKEDAQQIHAAFTEIEKREGSIIGYRLDLLDRIHEKWPEIECESQNTSTSDEALPIADVGGCTELDIEDAAAYCVEYYEKQSGENLTARERACFMDGYKVGGNAVRNRLTKKY